MPTYQFKCEKCKSTVSVTNPLSDEIKVPVCYSCEKEMTRIFGIPSVTFKGTGWGSDR